MTTDQLSDVVLDVEPQDQRQYERSAYDDYVRAWNDRVRALDEARRIGDLELAARLADELRHVWPQPADVAGAAWVSAGDRQSPLASERGL